MMSRKGSHVTWETQEAITQYIREKHGVSVDWNDMVHRFIGIREEEHGSTLYSREDVERRVRSDRELEQQLQKPGRKKSMEVHLYEKRDRLMHLYRNERASPREIAWLRRQGFLESPSPTGPLASTYETPTKTTRVYRYHRPIRAMPIANSSTRRKKR